MPAARKLLKETDQIIESYTNGMDLRTIARLYNVAAGTVRNILIRNNVTLRKRGRRKKETTNGTRFQTVQSIPVAG